VFSYVARSGIPHRKPEIATDDARGDDELGADEVGDEEFRGCGGPRVGGIG